MKKFLSLVLALCMCAMMTVAGLAESRMPEELNGTYIDLFPEFAKEEYKDFWMENIGAYITDAEAAEGTYTAMTQEFMGTLKGQAAIDAYAADPTATVFNCSLENGLKKVTVNNGEISGTDAEGKEVFRHTYRFLEDAAITYMGMDAGAQMHVYVTDDADAGDYTYFAFADDTIADTYHVEFRYGADKEGIGDFTDGAYAYWMAGAINEDYTKEQMEACIALFVGENLGEEDEAPAESAQVIEISTAEELAAINDNLSGSYVLTADIDLEGKEWKPIGTFVPTGETEEEQVVPPSEYAFTGSFNGQGHKISNLAINQPEGFAVGLFSVTSGADVGNFTLENADVTGTTMAADAIGYAYMSNVHDITIVSGKVTANMTELSAEGMYGSVAGACMGSLISGCTAQADISVGDNTGNIGIIGGGLQLTSVVDCRAEGTVTAGNNCYGLGGISGCGFGAEQFTNDVAENVVITAGDNCFWIGGITGYAGGYEDPELGTPVTSVTGCKANNVVIITGINSDGANALVGAGFFHEGMEEEIGPAGAAPTLFTLNECSAESVTINGAAAK